MKSENVIGTIGLLLLAGAVIVAAEIFLPDAPPATPPEITSSSRKKFYSMSLKELKDALKEYVAIEDYRSAIFLRDLIQQRTGVNQIKD